VGILLFAFAQALSAQEEKPRVAIFDPAGTAKNMDEGMAVVVREMVSAAIVNSGKYNIVERSLIDRVLKEQKFSNSGAVDETQISAIGKLAGANKVVLSVLSSAGSDKVLLSLKIIDVESAGIESQKTKVVKTDNLLDEITPLALALIGETVEVEEKSSGKSSSSFMSGLMGSKEKPKTADPKEKFAERNSNTVASDFSSSASQAQSKEVTLEFRGVAYSKNPTVQLFVDGEMVGSGTLNQGFAVRFTDNRPGKHTVKVEWSEHIVAKTYTINTAAKQHYTFEYAKTGFGYALQLKK
jgi:hypothetical protein